MPNNYQFIFMNRNSNLNSMGLDSLIENCISFFQKNRYRSGSITDYEVLWNVGIRSYMSKHNLDLYNPNVGQAFLEEVTCNRPLEELSYRERSKIRSIRILDDYLLYGYIRKRGKEPVKYLLDGTIGIEMQKYINHVVYARRSKSTIQTYKQHLSYFLKYLNNNGIYDANLIKECHILKYISARSDKSNALAIIKRLLNFWYENGIIQEDVNDYLKNYHIPIQEKIRSFYLIDEVKKIEQSVDRGSAIGRRNYAMLLLATRLGLRATDIARLSFSSIDWVKNEIVINQHKTEREVRLPLLTDIGNALIEYIKNGRPISESKQIFLVGHAPFIDASAKVVSGALGTLVTQSGVSIGNRHHGPHSMRHSLATTMMDCGTPIPVISSVLGHKSSNTTAKYINIDIESLLKCAMPVPPVDDSFYLQKGGAFYE